MEKYLDSLRDMACEELEKISKQERLTSETLDDAYKLIDIILDTYKVKEHKEEHEGYSNMYSRRMMPNNSYGYSYGSGEWTADGRYSNRMWPEMGGNSYARMRDSRGRYSREDGKARMIGRLESMAADADDMDRDAIYRCIEKLRND